MAPYAGSDEKKEADGPDASMAYGGFDNNLKEILKQQAETKLLALAGGSVEAAKKSKAPALVGDDSMPDALKAKEPTNTSASSEEEEGQEALWIETSTSLASSPRSCTTSPTSDSGQKDSSPPADGTRSGSWSPRKLASLARFQRRSKKSAGQVVLLSGDESVNGAVQKARREGTAISTTDPNEKEQARKKKPTDSGASINVANKESKDEVSTLGFDNTFEQTNTQDDLESLNEILDTPVNNENDSKKKDTIDTPGTVDTNAKKKKLRVLSIFQRTGSVTSKGDIEKPKKGGLWKGLAGAGRKKHEQQLQRAVANSYNGDDFDDDLDDEFTLTMSVNPQAAKNDIQRFVATVVNNEDDNGDLEEGLDRIKEYDLKLNAALKQAMDLDDTGSITSFDGVPLHEDPEEKEEEERKKKKKLERKKESAKARGEGEEVVRKREPPIVIKGPPRNLDQLKPKFMAAPRGAPDILVQHSWESLEEHGALDGITDDDDDKAAETKKVDEPVKTYKPPAGEFVTVDHKKKVKEPVTPLPTAGIFPLSPTSTGISGPEDDADTEIGDGDKYKVDPYGLKGTPEPDRYTIVSAMQEFPREAYNGIMNACYDCVDPINSINMPAPVASMLSESLADDGGTSLLSVENDDDDDRYVPSLGSTSSKPHKQLKETEQNPLESVNDQDKYSLEKDAADEKPAETNAADQPTEVDKPGDIPISSSASTMNSKRRLGLFGGQLLRRNRTSASETGGDAEGGEILSKSSSRMRLRRPFSFQLPSTRKQNPFSITSSVQQRPPLSTKKFSLNKSSRPPIPQPPRKKKLAPRKTVENQVAANQPTSKMLPMSKIKATTRSSEFDGPMIPVPPAAASKPVSMTTISPPVARASSHALGPVLQERSGLGNVYSLPTDLDNENDSLVARIKLQNQRQNQQIPSKRLPMEPTTKTIATVHRGLDP